MLKQRGRSCGGLVDKSLSAKARQPFALGYKHERIVRPKTRIAGEASRLSPSINPASVRPNL
jgi:hypothetical protein